MDRMGERVESSKTTRDPFGESAGENPAGGEVLGECTMTDPFKTIEMLARERNEMLANLTRTQERLARYIEIDTCAKGHIQAKNSTC